MGTLQSEKVIGNVTQQKSGSATTHLIPYSVFSPALPSFVLWIQTEPDMNIHKNLQTSLRSSKRITSLWHKIQCIEGQQESPQTRVRKAILSYLLTANKGPQRLQEHIRVTRDVTQGWESEKGPGGQRFQAVTSQLVTILPTRREQREPRKRITRLKLDVHS